MNEQRTASAFVDLADNLVADFDLIEFLWRLTDHCVNTLEVAAAGLLLADRNGSLRVMAASSDEVRLMELLQLQNDQGPCLACYRTGKQVSIPDISATEQRWPKFAEEAHRRGYTSVQALPMRLRNEVIGALNLFHTEARPHVPAAIGVAQAMADVATISVLQQRTAIHQDLLNQQLDSALKTRVIIEQAKGKLSERYDMTMDDAFFLLRSYARSHNRRLTDLAAAFINRTESLPDLRPGYPFAKESEGH